MDDETGETTDFKKCKFSRLQIALASQARAIFDVIEKFILH